MIRRRSSIIVGALVISLAIVLSGCTAGTSAPITEREAIADGASTLTQLAVPLSTIPAKYYAQRVAWHSCGADECGQISVPEDWSEPGGAAITLALIEHRATGTAQGTLVVNPGGPGGSGIEWVKSDFPRVVDSTIAASYNVVGFDPRGVGLSTPVTCLTAPQLTKYIFAPADGAVGSNGWISNEEHRAHVLGAGCDAKTGVLLDNLDTVSIAHDLDVIRSSLGQKKLTFFAASWGTFLGAVYAGLYPTKTGRLVLDGAFDPWSRADLTGSAQAVGFEGDLDAYVAACLKDSKKAVGKGSCPFSGDSPKAEHAIRAILTGADLHPLAGPHGLRLDGGMLSQAIIEALYSPRYWPYLTIMFTELLHGVTTEAMAFLGGRYGTDLDGAPVTNFEVAFTAMRCVADGPRVDLDRDYDEHLLLLKDAPVFGRWLGYDDVNCSDWPYGPAPFPVPVHASTAAPMLVIGTTGDPATPYQEAKDLAAQLTTSHLVTFHGEGHTAYDKGDACVNNAVDRFLLQGTVPKSDPDCH